MKIGEVAREAGLGVHAVRFYEREGLLPEPRRKASGYRDYPPEVVPRLRFIRRAKELGFSLGEILTLLELEGDSNASAAEVKQIAESTLEDVERRVKALQRMRRELRKLVDGCSGKGSVAECSILNALAEGT